MGIIGEPLGQLAHVAHLVGQRLELCPAIAVHRIGGLGPEQFPEHRDPLQRHLQVPGRNLADFVEFLARPFNHRGLGDDLALRGVVRRHIVQDADEDVLVALYRLAEREQHREQAAVLALPCHLAALADDLALASVQIVPHVTVVCRAMRLRHQHPHIGADQFVGLVAEQLGDCVIHVLDLAGRVGCHHTVDHRLQDRTLAAHARLEAPHEQAAVALFEASDREQQRSTDRQQREHQPGDLQVDLAHGPGQRRCIRQHQQAPLGAGQVDGVVTRDKLLGLDAKVAAQRIPCTGAGHFDQARLVAVDQQDTRPGCLLCGRDQLSDAVRRHADEEQAGRAVLELPFADQVEMVGVRHRVYRRQHVLTVTALSRVQIVAHRGLADRPDQAVEVLEQWPAVRAGDGKRNRPAEHALDTRLQRLDRRPVVGKRENAANLVGLFQREGMQALVLAIDETDDLVRRRPTIGPRAGLDRIDQGARHLMPVIDDPAAGHQYQQQGHPKA